MSNLSPSTRSLLQAAKQDGPSREKRAAIWSGVTSGLVTHTPLKIQPQNAASSGAAKSTFWAGASMKGAFIGALFGSAISIGVATFMLRAKTEATHVVPPPVLAQAAAPVTAPANAQTANPQVVNAQGSNAAGTNAAQSIELPSDTANDKSDAKSAGNSAVSSSTSNSSTAGKTTARAAHNAKKESTGTPDSPDDLLSREVALVSEANRQLLTGDAAGALKSVRAARSLEARQMEPEEMKIEARALHALGRDAEAERVESSLRSMYPGR